jgi:type II secretory pathway component PulJ
MTRRAGSTLAEMLMACGLLSMLLLAAAGMHAEARRSTTASQEVALRGQIVELAAELLQYHLGLAGHRGVKQEGDLQGPALAVGPGAGQGGSDTLAVRYIEERWYGGAELRALRFDVKRDGNGLWNLYQQEAGATRQPAVQRVSGLAIVNFVGTDGRLLPGDSTLPLEAVALELELRFDWGESRLVGIALPGVQLVETESR